MKIIAKLVDAVSYENKLPVNFAEQDRWLFETHIHTEIREAKLYLGQHILFTTEHIVFDNFKVWRDEQTNHYIIDRWYLLKRIIKLFLRPTKKLKGKYLLVTDDWSWSYFHWTGDVLQKVYLVKDQLKEYTILLPESFKKYAYIQESLDLFNAKVYYFNERENLRIEELLIPAPIGSSGVFQYEVINGLADYLKRQVNKSNQIGEKFEKVYISRKNARQRKITNEDAVCDFLISQGFRILETEQLSLTSQIQIMQNCKWLISLHGAGLTNELYLNEGANVLEIRHPKDYLNNGYYLLATALKLNYYYFLSDAENNDAHIANMYINIASFKNLVLEIINKQ